MNTQADNYLWDPSAPPDAEIERLERALRPVSARALGMDLRPVPIKKGSHWNPWQRVGVLALAASFVAFAVTDFHYYRLSWKETAPWSVRLARSDGTRQDLLLHVGEEVVTTSEQSATIDVARIGTVIIAPNSEAKLIRTEKDRHRLELERGRLHAKIWAPPNYFGVSHGDASFVDMGCEFDLQIEAAGRGALTVQSGWVFYSVGFDEILVPEHYTLNFDNSQAELPARVDATNEFRRAANELNSVLSANTAIDQAATELAGRIAAVARDEDYYTLYVLLRRHPELAAGPLYDRLGSALKATPDESHRARWIRGDRDAVNEWWQLWPTQPKKWWVNWRDAF